MYLRLVLIALLSALVFGASPTRARASDTNIFPAGTLPITDDPPKNDRPKWFKDANRLIEQLIQGMLGAFIADQSGLEHPAPDESPKDVFALRLGKSHFKVMLQGAGNLRVLQNYKGYEGNYVFTVLQGGLGAEYDVVIPDGTDHSTTVAIRLSPIYGEIALIRTPNNELSTALPPQGVFAGSSLGIELSKRFGGVEPGARAYTRTEWENINFNSPSLSYYAAVYCRFYLNQIFADDSKDGAKFILMPIISYYDRGDARDDMYSWNRAMAYGDVKGLSDLRRFWEGQIKLEIKF